MTILEKLSALRKIMERDNLDAYIVSGSDPHNSEYLPATWQQREWLSGFTGSFGTIVILKDDAGIWTDTRYFIQVEKQLAGSGVRLHKLRVEGAVDYPEWLSENLAKGDRVGIDSFCTSVSSMKHLKELLEVKEIEVLEKSDLLGDIWLDRPALPENLLFPMPTVDTGVSAKEKIQILRGILVDIGADYFLFSALDEIAWMYNIRCSDIEYNPVAISYAIVGKEKAYLFIKRPKVSAEVSAILQQEGIEVHDYHHLFLFLDEIKKDKSCFCVDINTLNYAVYNKIVSLFSVKELVSPIILAKSIKTEVEIDGFRRACIKDGIAMTKFFYWLESNIGNQLSETTVSNRLTAFRTENEGYVSNSFGNISAYGVNAALPHYSAIPGDDAILEPKGLYLVDSGGQYTHGTTDITRTVSLGEVSQLEKEDYTIVLKGMISLSQSIFPKGTRGCNLDILARQAMWQTYRNFGHGTGHGIGFFLNVHEGPQAIRQDLKEQAILSGMVTSNEPGLYREGSHGIRHENMILCTPLTVNEFGEWLGFETLTLCYIDTFAILPELLNQDEKMWLNTYNGNVFEKISPFLSTEEVDWLAQKTKEI